MTLYGMFNMQYAAKSEWIYAPTSSVVDSKTVNLRRCRCRCFRCMFLLFLLFLFFFPFFLLFFSPSSKKVYLIRVASAGIMPPQGMHPGMPVATHMQQQGMIPHHPQGIIPHHPLAQHPHPQFPPPGVMGMPQGEKRTDTFSFLIYFVYFFLVFAFFNFLFYLCLSSCESF